MSGVRAIRVPRHGGESAERRENTFLLGEVLIEVVRRQPHLARGWFPQLRSEELEGGVFRVRASNAAQAAYLRENCVGAFVAAAQAVSGRLLSVAFDVFPAEPPKAAPVSHVESEYSFENFVVAPCNRFAQAAAVAVGDTPGSTYNPLFIHGGRGIGKTHLLRATAARLARRVDGEVICTSGSAWTAELVRSLEEGSVEPFRRRYGSAAAIALDDVQLLAGRSQSLDELFHATDDLLASGRQLVFASNVAPQELTGFPERLLSRFQAGLVAAMDPPDEESLRAIATEKARALAIELPGAVVNHLAEAVGGSCSRLAAAITRLDALAREERVPMTATLADRALDLCGEPPAGHGAHDSLLFVESSKRADVADV